MDKTVSLPEEIANFREGSLTAPGYQDAIRDSNIKLLNLETADYDWRILAREQFFWFIIHLLVAQNILVYLALYWCRMELQHLQILFGTLITGTLAETYLILNHVVKWLFTNVNYKIRKTNTDIPQESNSKQ